MRIMRKFKRSESGTATVEAMLWFVFMSLFSVLVVDSTNAFYSYSGIAQSIQDGNRQLSIGRFKSEAETEFYIEQQLTPIYANADARVVLNGNMAETTVTIPWASFGTVGYLSSFGSRSVSFNTIHRVEWIP